MILTISKYPMFEKTVYDTFRDILEMVICINFVNGFHRRIPSQISRRLKRMCLGVIGISHCRICPRFGTVTVQYCATVLSSALPIDVDKSICMTDSTWACLQDGRYGAQWKLVNFIPQWRGSSVGSRVCSRGKQACVINWILSCAVPGELSR